MPKASPKAYTINDIVGWNNQNEIVLSPKYQRRSVWSDKAKSYLIDTIVRGFPIPKIFIKHDVDMKTKKTIREIVDGQQRVKTILSFLNDGFKILKIHNDEFGGIDFSNLPEEMRKKILLYEISVDILNDSSEKEILEMFARLNTYTVVLKKQELLNAKYFGAFKTSVYALGYEFLNFWIKNKVLTEKYINRMGEAEFASELAIVVLEGIKDRKVIESFYKKYDDDFPDAKEMVKNFRENMDFIAELMQGDLSNSNFSSIPLFYSLFSVVNGLRKEDKLRKNYIPKISNALADIDSILESRPEEMKKDLFNFVEACTKHVTDLEARKIRHDYIYTKIKSVI